MAQSLPKPALRPFLAADTPVLAVIFAAAIQELTGDDYSEAQQEAWAARLRTRRVRQPACRRTDLIANSRIAVGFPRSKGPTISRCCMFIRAWSSRASVKCCATRWKNRRRPRHKESHRRCQRHRHGIFARARLQRKATQYRDVNGERRANTTMQKTLAGAAPGAPNEPRTPLSVRHHAARRRADQRRGFHAA